MCNVHVHVHVHVDMYTYIAHACTRVYVHMSIPGRKENRTCPEEVILTLRPSQTHALHVHVYMYMYMYMYMEKYPFYSVLAKEESEERKREGMYRYMYIICTAVHVHAVPGGGRRWARSGPWQSTAAQDGGLGHASPRRR